MFDHCVERNFLMILTQTISSYAMTETFRW